MITNKHFSNNDIDVWFHKETDENGNLIIQSANYRNNKYGYIDSDHFHKIDKATDIDCREMLCHVTSKDLVKDILKNGLKPDIGQIYLGYWDRGLKSEELANLLEPGIFLMRKGKSFNPYFKKNAKLYIITEGLDKEHLYIDHAWSNGESLFYTKPIPPELIKLKRI